MMKDGEVERELVRWGRGDDQGDSYDTERPEGLCFLVLTRLQDVTMGVSGLEG